MGEKNILIFTFGLILMHYVTFSCQLFKINVVVGNILCPSISEFLSYKQWENISLTEFYDVYVCI
jgi:hypothetical protein